MSQRIKFITTAAIIAALYAVITIAIPFSYGQLQIRFSELLTVLPFFTPAAIPGLFVGCILGNLASPLGPIDIMCGSLATLLAAYLTYKVPGRFKILAPLPPVVINAIVVSIELKAILGLPVLITALWVAAGEVVACYVLGYPFMRALEKFKGRLFLGQKSL